MTKDDNRRKQTPPPPSAPPKEAGFAVPFETPLGTAVILALAPFRTYYVGGCVRDALLGLPAASALDMATAAPPETAEALLAPLGGQLLFGGLGAVRVEDGSCKIELTSMRTEGPYSDRRHPDWVEFVTDPELDARRRDYTAGAVYWNPQEGFVDPCGGVADIEAGILRAIGKPDHRFDEDPLRILRGLRFAARFGFSVEPTTAEAMRRMAPLLGFVSGERAAPELFGMLIGNSVEPVLLAYGEVLSALIPEIRPALRCPQKSRFHCYGVWEHTVKAITASPPDPLLRLALLLHDLGKPRCRRRDTVGNDHFQGHMREGAGIARRTAERLSLPKDQARELETLVLLHDDRIRRRVPDIARLLGQMGETATRRLIELRAADNAAKAPAVREPARREEMHALVDEILRSGLPLTRKDLAVTGSSVPAEGPMVGAALDQLLEAVWNGEIENEPEALLEHLQTMYDY